MKELVKSLFGTKDEQSSEMGAVFADIATTIRDEDEEQAQIEAEDDEAEATFAPFSLETVETVLGYTIPNMIYYKHCRLLISYSVCIYRYFMFDH